MSFTLINMENWKRKEYYSHYMQNVRCTYSLTTNIDITCLKHEIKKMNKKIYPALIYMITTAVNQQTEFRMSKDNDGRLGYWKELIPSYTIFNKEKKVFSSIWTEYDEYFPIFYSNCIKDITKYSDSTMMNPKLNEPQNVFTISSLPWTSFTSFNLNVYTNGDYLLPIFTIGKFIQQNEQVLMPLALQVHHAVCDGFHTGKFITSLQTLADNYLEWING